MNYNKRVAMKRTRATISERQYMRSIIHNLSLQRWTDQEIADYLSNEKGLDIARCTVTIARNQIQKQAEKWYIELKQSRYKYIATYKERLDSLLSYQRRLNEIILATKKEDTKIRGISALASIEMDIFTIWKQLPDLDIVERVKQDKDKEKEEEQEQEEVVSPEWA